MSRDRHELTPVEAAVLDAIDVDAVTATVAELVAVPSVGGAETPAQERVAAFLRQAALDTETWDIDLPALASHERFSAEIPREEAVGVVGSLGAGEGPSLLLNGHVDVVPPGDETDWSTPPWEARVRGGRVYGRGTCDMKGGLACGLHAARAIADTGVELAGRLVITPVIGEEDGGAGTLAALLHGVTADAAVVMEPTDLAVAPSQAGALSFRVTVRGLAAHGALREEGVSAIEKYRVVQDALLDLEERRNIGHADPMFGHLHRPFAICVGRVEAGDWPSSEADWLRAEGRYGVAPSDDLDAARAEFEEAVATAGVRDPWLRDHPPAVEWWGGQFHPAATPPDHAIVTSVEGACASATGTPPRVEGVPYGSDMGLLAGVGGIPTVVFGPGDVRVAHRPDEFVPIDQLLDATRTLALTALRFCGVRSG
jgi:acetylornithine deacetylase